MHAGSPPRAWGVIAFCVVLGVTVLMYAATIMAPRSNAGALTYVLDMAALVLCGVSLQGLWRLKRWAIPACALVIVVMEIFAYLAGDPTKLVPIIVRTGLWLVLLWWTASANKSRFS